MLHPSATARRHLSGFVLLPFLILSLTACDDFWGDIDGAPEAREELCETTCERVYEACSLSLDFADHTPASQLGCVNACIFRDFFRGNEECVLSAACVLEEIVDCIHQEPEPEPEPEPEGKCQEDTSEWTEAWNTLETDVLAEVNRVRAAGAKCGTTTYGPAAALVMEDALRCAARLFSKDMAERGFFDHTNPEGVGPFERIPAAGYTGGHPMGENIAAGYPTAADVMGTWMDSPGHCKNIMNPEFRELGVGYYYLPSAEYRHLWTQTFGGGRR